MLGTSRIFINYRRADTRWAAARLYEGLVQSLGVDRLFIDVDSIPPGVDFAEHLNNFVDQSKAIIVLIGPNWLEVTNDRGERRINDPNDYVNIEIRRALERKVSVIPVLVDGASLPTEDQLPEGLKNLARRQATRLRHESYGQDIDRLSRALADPARTRKSRKHLPDRRKAGRRKTDWPAHVIALGSALLTCCVMVLAWGAYQIATDADERPTPAPSALEK